jgi:DNA-binding GntR family transcriptional regulator
MLKYQKIYNDLKIQIQQGFYKSGDLLPSENELCNKYSITRTTSRKALDELLKEGFIEKKQGLGSVVKERRKSLGLLNVKGFSEAGGSNVKNIFLQKPVISEWSDQIIFPVSEEENHTDCIHFERLRCIGPDPVMVEYNWLANFELSNLLEKEFVDQSFFKTLSQQYLIEIIGSKHEIRAEFANKKIALLLKVDEKTPVLHISVMFITSKPGFNIYAELYCITEKYPVSNFYKI